MSDVRSSIFYPTIRIYLWEMKGKLFCSQIPSTKRDLANLRDSSNLFVVSCGESVSYSHLLFISLLFIYSLFLFLSSACRCIGKPRGVNPEEYRERYIHTLYKLWYFDDRIIWNNNFFLWNFILLNMPSNSIHMLFIYPPCRFHSATDNEAHHAIRLKIFRMLNYINISGM